MPYFCRHPCAACGRGVPEPWPLSSWQDLCYTLDAAIYLDSLTLLLAAARSFRLAAGQNSELELAAKLAKAASHFSRQEQIVSEMQDTLRALPKHQLQLTPELMEAPEIGLAVLEIFEAAPETLVGHIKTVRSFIVGTSLSSPHSFAVKLFECHEANFVERPSEMIRLLRHLDVAKRIEPPTLAFRLAAAAAAARASAEAEDEGCLVLQIFERCFDGAVDPVDIACDAACLNLFSDSEPLLSLDTLARPPGAKYSGATPIERASDGT